MTTPLDADRFLPAIVLGDERAFAQFLAEIEAPLRRSLRAFASSVDTEAVVQETMLRLWQVAPRIEPDGRPHGGLRLAQRIARNLAIDELRRHRKVVPSEEPPPEPAPTQTESDPMLRWHLEQCFEALPARPRQALWLRLEETGSEPEARLAERLGMTLNTFFQNVARARRFLLECLGKRGVSALDGAPLTTEVSR